MKILRFFGATLAILGWMAFAFSPRTKAATGPPSLEPDAAAVREVPARVLNQSDQLAIPGSLRLIGHHLVLLDNHGDYAVRVLSPVDGHIERSFGVRGEGPGEFRAARAVAAVPGDEDAFWVYDIALSRLTRFDLDRSTAAARPWEARTFTLSSSAPVTDPVWLPGGGLLALGFFPEGRLGLFDEAGHFAGAVGKIPSGSGSREVPPSVLQQAYMGRIAPDPGRTRFAIGSRYAGRLAIYGSGGQLLRLARVPHSFEPRFTVRGRDGVPSMASGGDMRFGYIDVSATEGHIYALFSGRTRAGFPGRANYGEYVHVFDWDGNLERVLHLDFDAISIAADGTEGILYAVRHLPLPAVMKVDLPG